MDQKIVVAVDGILSLSKQQSNNFKTQCPMCLEDPDSSTTIIMSSSLLQFLIQSHWNTLTIFPLSLQLLLFTLHLKNSSRIEYKLATTLGHSDPCLLFQELQSWFLLWVEWLLLLLIHSRFKVLGIRGVPLFLPLIASTLFFLFCCQCKVTLDTMYVSGLKVM